VSSVRLIEPTWGDLEVAKFPRIALIHATPIAMEPIASALSVGWPEAEVVNILEDSLSGDRASAKSLGTQLADRIISLARYARGIGSQGILFTCSAFGPAIERAAELLDVPVLKPNEAMFELALKQGGKIAMLYTFPPSRESMEQEFWDEAAKVSPNATITSFLVPGAIEAIKSGNVETHNSLVAEMAQSLSGFDAITLAHFSTARALAVVRRVTITPVLTSPDAAVTKLRALVSTQWPSGHEEPESLPF
jgi:Asp/Glu/hydantoin racemase